MILVLFSASSVWSSTHTGTKKSDEPSDAYFGEQKQVFIQSIPSIAEQFVGIPFELGGNPRQSGTSDNSYLFFSIYALAAQKAGLSYEGYLPMVHLITNTRQVNKDELQNGDIMLLNDDLAAMIYRIEPSGKMHFIYASEKRKQITAFHSENILYQAFWLENLKGFFRLSDSMLETIP